MPKKPITDRPCVSMLEAAVLLGMGHRRFRARFKTQLHKEIDSVMTKSGVRLLLVDVLKAAYPGASKHTIHIMALQYTLDAHEKRVTEYHQVRRGKRDEKSA